MGNIFNWDPDTAANNDDIDPTINWREGQLASTVNGSARAMMQRIAQFINDTSGKIVTGGSSNAYTVTTKSGNTAYAEPLVLAFEANRTCTGAPTLAVDGLSAKPMFAANGGALGARSIVSSGFYIATYKEDYAGFVILNIEQQPRTTAVYTTPGTSSFTVPNGVYFIRVKVWGAGGGGGGVGSGGGAAAGGSGAQYREGIVSVTPGDVITVTVGAGGANGNGTPTGGSNGGSSSFGSLIVAVGGRGGAGAGSGSLAGVTAPLTGGSGGTVIIPGASANAGLSIGGTTVGSAGGGAFGSAATIAISTAAGNGGSYPGGGGGGGGGSTNADGAAGSDGLVIIEYPA